MVTPGAQAVCLCFPHKEAIKEEYREEDAKFKEVGQESVDPTIFWMKQTVRPVGPPVSGGAVLRGGLCVEHFTNQIPNACGTMALIHALANVCVYS